MAIVPGKSVIVVGAGAFGGWTALNLLRSGASVTLIEARDAGNPLASSGGESRVIRHIYTSRIYVDMTKRALELWKEADRLWGRDLLHQRGVLFMSRGGSFLHTAADLMEEADVEFERLTPTEIATRYPQINTDDIDHAIFEPGAGYLVANRACEAVRDAFIAEGGNYLQTKAMPGPVVDGEMQGIRTEGGQRLEADQLVFACGPWLKAMFPGLLNDYLNISRQELYFFQAPHHLADIFGSDLPVWADVGESLWYGIPGPGGIFKLGDDKKGREVDPETQNREPTESGIESARQFIAHRFPQLKDAAFVDSRVCQYSTTPDDDFIMDRHPKAENTWLLGGGSGHGFKHGPVFGEMAATCILGHNQPMPEFSLRRFTSR